MCSLVLNGQDSGDRCLERRTLCTFTAVNGISPSPTNNTKRLHPSNRLRYSTPYGKRKDQSLVPVNAIMFLLVFHYRREGFLRPETCYPIVLDQSVLLSPPQ